MTNERLEPVPDNPAGENVAYRGAVDHGVPFTEAQNTDEAHYHTGRPVEYEPEMPSDKVIPVPVRIVREGAREVSTFKTLQFTLAVGEKREIMGRDDRRTVSRVKFVGEPADAVFVGDSNVSIFSGWLLDALPLELHTTEPVWVVSQAADIVIVFVYLETVEAVR